MFDLFRSRDKAVRYLLGALLGLVALSMVITLIPGYGASSAPREQVVAQIGDQSLTVREVQQTISGAMKNRQIPPEMVQFYVPQLIDQMITERAVAYQASRMGFVISDEELATAIRSIVGGYFPNGQIDAEGYRRFIAQQGLTIDQFEHNVRTNMLLLRLQNIALEGVIVTPDEVEKEYHRKNDKIKVEYVKWTAPTNLASQVTVTPEEARAYYNSQKGQYNTPEKKSFNLLIADESKIGASLQTSEADLRAAYNASMDKYRTPERVHIRHILIKTTDKSPADVTKAEAKAKDLLKQIRGGADFAKLAKENSEDPGSAAKGGDLDWVTRGQMVKPFEDASFALKPNQISDLVKTEYGFHILQSLGREEARVKPFEEVKGELATERNREQIFNRMQQAIEQARAELVKTPQNAEAIAAKYNLTYAHADKLGRGESIPVVGTSAEVENAAATLKKGEVSQVFQIGQNRLAVVNLTDVIAPHPAEFADVEKQILDTLKTQKAQQLAEQKVKEATDKLKTAATSGADLKAAAKQVGGEVKTADFFTIDSAAEGIGPASYLTEGFAKPVGSTVGPFAIGSDVFLAKVTDKQSADMSKLPAEREALVIALKRKRALERKELFEDGLMTQLIKEGKIKKNNDTITRLVQGMKG